MDDQIINENTANEFSFDDLSEFSTGNTDSVTLEDEEIKLTEDVEGFANGFPNWALHPPINF